jgi:hypothetical protein
LCLAGGAAGRLADLAVVFLAALWAGGAFFAGLAAGAGLPFVAFGVALAALPVFCAALRTGGLVAVARLAGGLG